MAADIANFPAPGEAARSDAPLPPAGGLQRWMPRRRERRAAMAAVLAALTRSLDRRFDISLMRGAFEETLRRVLGVQSVHLRENGSRWNGREGPSAPESMAVEVPGSDPEMPGVLEAAFHPGCVLGEWDFQMLGLGAHVGALVLEIERLRLQLARAGLYVPPRLPRRETDPLVGSTEAVRALRATIARVAATDFVVLLEGESGVGKELVARQIHEASARRTGPFVAINCAALVETLLEAELFGIEDRTATGVRGRRGKFEAADGGTLFLDEVGDLSASAQAKLLRTIQDLVVERVGGNGGQRVNVRIIAATNRSLRELVDRRQFRLDLFYRLSGVDIRVPPLRERRADIVELAEHFLDRHRSVRSLRLSPAAAEALMGYAWPGNVRELERLIEWSVTMADSDVLDLGDLPESIRGDYTALLGSVARPETMRAWACRYARLVLDRCGGNKRHACRVLDVSYHTLQSYLRASQHERVVPASWVAQQSPPVGTETVV